MTEHPILFSAPMVNAILAGRKTQTRRILKPFGKSAFKEKLRLLCLQIGVLKVYTQHIDKCPYGKPGNHLWVRETLCNDGDGDWAYCADNVYLPMDCPDGWRDKQAHKKSIPSIHMPRWASRIQLEITDIRIERLKDISEEDAKAEGVEYETADPPFYYVSGYWPHSKTAVETYEGRAASFHKLWDLINGKPIKNVRYDWDSNPWVWVVEFKRV